MSCDTPVHFGNIIKPNKAKFRMIPLTNRLKGIFLNHSFLVTKSKTKRIQVKILETKLLFCLVIQKCLSMLASYYQRTT